MNDSTSDEAQLEVDELRDAWRLLLPEERLEGFRSLGRAAADDFLLAMPTRDQAQLLLMLSPGERRSSLRLLPPDDAVDVIQQIATEDRAAFTALLDAPTQKEVNALLAYAEDDAGGLMNPRFVRVRPEMRVDEAISYLRKQIREHPETVYYVYVLDSGQRLLGVISFRELFSATPERTVRDIMQTDLVTVPEEMDQEAVSRLFAEHDLIAIPVLDAERRMKGIVSIDDIVDVVQEEATEDIQKFGGMEALGAPYLAVGFLDMVKKRGGWLSALFLGEMLTATAMGFFEAEIARAIVLSLFIPLIISSGGNSGSQASTLVVRALALGELKLRDWWRVARREIASGIALGSILGAIGLARILLWRVFFHTYGEQYAQVAITVALSLVGVVTFGTLAGSMLPFLLRRLGFDPASASAPFVATLVDVTGLVIYFTVAQVILL